MSRDDRYYARSWAMLTRDRGWAKPLLVMASAQTAAIMLLVSALLFVIVATESLGGAIAGGFAMLTLLVLTALIVVISLAVSGYMLEWARLTAWEVDAAPKQRGVQVGACIKAGWRGFVASLGYGVVFSLLVSLLTGLFSNSFLSGLVALVVMVANVFVSVCLMVVKLHATIYQSIGAGYRLQRIWNMISGDAVGLAKIAGIMVLIDLVAGVVVSIVAAVTGIAVLVPALVVASGSGSTTNMILGVVTPLMSWCVPTLFVAMLFSTFSQLIGNTAVALWMRQYHVPLWGGSSDPLPSLGGLPVGTPDVGADTGTSYSSGDAATNVWQNAGMRDASASSTHAPSSTGFDPVGPAPMGTGAAPTNDEGYDAFVNADASWPVTSTESMVPNREADGAATSADTATSASMSTEPPAYEANASMGFAPPSSDALSSASASVDAANASTNVVIGSDAVEALDSNHGTSERSAGDGDRESLVSSQPWSREAQDWPSFSYADDAQAPWPSIDSVEVGMPSSADESNPVNTASLIVDAPAASSDIDGVMGEQVDAPSEDSTA